jgi:hypothetical protein
LIGLAGKMGRILRETSEPLLFCSDLSSLNIMPTELADQLLEMLKRFNPRVERNAILLSQQRAGVQMQITRIVREAKNPGRRVFSAPAELSAWLDEVITEAERSRLRFFLQAR